MPDLHRIALFDTIPREELASLALLTPVRTYAKHAILVHEGDAPGPLYILLAGRVKFFLTAPTGREFVLGTAGPGEYFGEIALDGDTRSASVMTLEPCRCAIVPQEDLQAFIARHPGAALTMLRNLTRRVRALTQTVGNLALSDVYGRVAHLLRECGKGADGEVTLTHQAIADRVGASRQMVSRILGDLAAGGYLARDGRRLVVLRALPHAW